MLKSPFKFLGFNRHDKTPKTEPQNDRKTKGKLRKTRNPNITVDQSTPMEAEEKANISTVHPEEKDSMEYYQMQPAGILLNSQETAGQSNINANAFSPHTQTDETNHLSSSISEDPNQDFSEGSEKPRRQTPTSVAPTRLWSSIRSTRRDSFGAREGDPSTHEWNNDRGGVRVWRDGVNSDIHRAPRRITLPNVDPDQPDVQDLQPKVSPPEEDEHRARRESVDKYDRETRKAAVMRRGDRAEDEICYYIVPAGLDIIFQDEDGTQITRVGKTIKGTQNQSSHVHSKNIPIVVQDVFGNELFRSWTLEAIDDSSLPQRLINVDPHDPNIGIVDAMAGDDFVGRRLPPSSHSSWKAIIVDEKGNQIPLKKYVERK